MKSYTMTDNNNQFLQINQKDVFFSDDLNQKIKIVSMYTKYNRELVIVTDDKDQQFYSESQFANLLSDHDFKKIDSDMMLDMIIAHSDDVDQIESLFNCVRITYSKDEYDTNCYKYRFLSLTDEQRKNFQGTISMTGVICSYFNDIQREFS